MPDTHDERGGDEAAVLLAIRRRALTAATYAEWHQVGRDIETPGQKLANATARAEKAEALVAELSEEWGYRFGVGCGEDGFDSETTARLIAAPGDRIVHRLIGEWREAPDAAPGGLSATETDAEPSKAPGVELEFGKGAAELSEPEPPRDTSAWCWAPNPSGPLRCGRLRDHEPAHQRGERTWTDDDTTGADR